VEYIKKLLEAIGLQGQRIQMINISSAMGSQFALQAAALNEEIRQLGPNPLRDPAGEEQDVEHVTRPTEEIS